MQPRAASIRIDAGPLSRSWNPAAQPPPTIQVPPTTTPSLAMIAFHFSTFRSIWLCLALLFCGPAAPGWANEFGLFTYRVYVSQIDITGYPTDAVGAVEIPAMIAGRPVRSILASAFEGCTGLTSVTIPSSVRTIGNVAFRGCTGLTSVTLSTGVTSIGISAFESCTGLTSIILPSSVTSIPEAAFRDCSALASVTLPPSVTSIPEAAFSGCSALTSIPIPPSVSSIGTYAFDECSALTSVSIPSSVSSMAEQLFFCKFVIYC